MTESADAESVQATGPPSPGQTPSSGAGVFRVWYHASGRKMKRKLRVYVDTSVFGAHRQAQGAVSVSNGGVHAEEFSGANTKRCRPVDMRSPQEVPRGEGQEEV